MLKYFETIDYGDVSESSIPVRVLTHLLKLIDNNDFKEHFKDDYGYPKTIDKITKNDIEWAIKWFRINKEKIISNKSHVPLLNDQL